MFLQASSIRIAVAVLALASAPASSAALSLDPLSAAPQSSGGGVSATWVQVRDDAHFSTQPWAEAGGPALPIGSYAWGDGIWGTGDVNVLMGLPAGDPMLVGRVGGLSAISFANTVYNGLAGSGSYGSWGYDYARPLAPIVAQTGQQTNYAARFSGYLYVAEAGLYDFGLFSDDGFVFSLSGNDGAYAVAHTTHAGSTSGRDYYTLSGANGNAAIELDKGYYGLSLDYYNRLEAGVIDLAWWQPGTDGWRSIEADRLFDRLPQGGSAAVPPAAVSVPEPGVLSLIGLVGVAAAMLRRRRRTR